MDTNTRHSRNAKCGSRDTKVQEQEAFVCAATWQAVMYLIMCYSNSDMTILSYICTGCRGNWDGRICAVFKLASAKLLAS